MHALKSHPRVPAQPRSSGLSIAIDELKEGSNDLSQKNLHKHIEADVKASLAGYVDDSVCIPLLTTPDRWRIKLTACSASRYGPRSTSVMQEAWGRDLHLSLPKGWERDVQSQYAANDSLTLVTEEI